MTETVKAALWLVLKEALQVGLIYHVETDAQSEIGGNNYFFEIAENELER